MSIPAWQIIFWRRVQVEITAWQRFTERLRPLGASIRAYDSSSGLSSGHVVWGTGEEVGRIGIAWDWEELVDGVVVLSDPMSILTNFDFVDDHGNPISCATQILHLNTTIYALGWQSVICAEKGKSLVSGGAGYLKGSSDQHGPGVSHSPG